MPLANSAVKLLVFAGSTRTDSLNKKLAAQAAHLAQSAGAQVTTVDLRDLPMPLYDQDLQQKTFPEHALTFKKHLNEHHGFIIACPEYNGSVTGVLKNAIDWASRSDHQGEPSLVCFRNKTVLLLSASTGALGGIRGLRHMREMFTIVGSFVYTDHLALPAAADGFEANGSLKDPKRQQSLTDLTSKFVSFTGKLAE